MPKNFFPWWRRLIFSSKIWLIKKKKLAAFYHLTYQHESKDFNICNYKPIVFYFFRLDVFTPPQAQPPLKSSFFCSLPIRRLTSASFPSTKLLLWPKWALPSTSRGVQAEGQTCRGPEHQTLVDSIQFFFFFFFFFYNCPGTGIVWG